MKNFALEQIINKFLLIETIKDYTINGLQIEGRSEVKTIITGVTASKELIDYAVQQQADAILVHHGYFWNNENPAIIGMKYRRFKTILNYELNVYAYHLPLDTHPQIGNNVLFAKALNLNNLQTLDVIPNSLAIFGDLQNPMQTSDLLTCLINILEHERIFVQENTNKRVKKIGLCTGAGQDFIEQAIKQGCDTFITGEVSERTVLIAKENNVNFYACGHHVTERFGIKALGEWLQKKYDLQVYFKDCYNPI